MQYSEGNTYSQIIAVTTVNRDFVIANCRNNNVDLGMVLEYAIPKMVAYGNNKYDFGNAEFYSRQIINLPVSGKYKLVNAIKVVEAVNGLGLEKEK